MLDALESLPEDPAELSAVSELLMAEVQSLTYQNEKLKVELHGHRKAQFGSKSEGLDQLALDLSDDQEIEAAADAQHAEQGAGDEDPATTKPSRPKRKHNRAPLPDHLDREDEVLSAGDECGDCGEDVTEELEHIPGRFVVHRIIRPRMACSCCEAFAQAPLPSRPIERARPAPGL